MSDDSRRYPPKFGVGDKVIDLNGVERIVTAVPWDYAYELDHYPHLFQPSEVKAPRKKRKKHDSHPRT